MLRAMPSPTGRNTEGLYIIARRNPQMAFDEAPGPMTDEDKLALLNFLRDRLSEEDHRAAAKLLGADPDAAMDDLDLPKSGLGKFAQDARFRRPMSTARRGDFARRFPHASKIRVHS
jgi:hypothetical protein